MKKIAIILLVMFAFCAGGVIEAYPQELRVMVEVLGDQKDEVRKYVGINLGMLDDVIVVKENPNVYIHIITRKLATNKGAKLGYVMTSASSEVLEMTVEGGRPFIVSDYSGLWLEVGPDVYVLSEQCVKAINASVFERFRETAGGEG